MDGTTITNRARVNAGFKRVFSVSLPSVQVGCGLGAVLVLMLLLFVIYHVFWLELLLIYRSWFGTKERDSGEKQQFTCEAKVS